ncbi:hypothetical protein Tco_0841717 [Tanacetum coccineum]|uniref:Uncharacterized protein n=1 Tax=Tanacetum coccineum TaxID=301880 RepID=A0ABQ5AXU7_9ASTR
MITTTMPPAAKIATISLWFWLFRWTSGSVSPASEQQSTDRLESSSSQNSDNCNNSYTPSEPQQQQGSPALPSFSAYDPQTGYVLMPGVNSPHVNANGIKYAIPQFKSIQGGSPTGFGNFTSPNGYTLNPGVVGSASGLDDSSRLKYKDENVYVPNPQAETSELWMNPRDMPAHIRVSETDRCRLTFGTLGIDIESSKNPGYQEARLVEKSHLEPLARLVNCSNYGKK